MQPNQNLEHLIRIEGLHKSFNTPVLKGVNLTIERGQVHALVGENGAGKSTLSSILAGLISADQGLIELDAEEYKPHNARYAFSCGISLVAQELSVVPTLTVGENICLRSLPTRNKLIDMATVRAKANELLQLLGLGHIQHDQVAESLTLGESQLVEIAKAMMMPCKLLILDEPTAALTAQQADKLHSIIRDLASNGTAIVYISHRLEDVREISDTISVLRDGVVVKSSATKDLTVEDMIYHMSGKEPGAKDAIAEKRIGKPLMVAKSLTTDQLLEPIELTCHENEIVGIAGLAGSGRTELLNAIYGLKTLTGGTVTLDIDGESKAINNPADAVKSGMGYLPKERKTQGIFPGQAIAMNATLPGLKSLVKSFGVFSHTAEKNVADELIEALSVKCNNAEQHIDKLSGGNQQKVLIGRWVHCDSKVLLMDEPTRGVDVGAKASIHKLLKNMAASGKSVLVASSEIEELMELCDRIIVLSNRKYVASFKRDEWTYNGILESAFSEYQVK